ncbi:MAG: hypothetical protein M1544_03400, partial [Candidatus Marsarchaeota archaeon]|nr:hypothetical protein [Candidatus Marsarchaeota archaeon]
LVLLSIESRDMQKNPFLFFIITLKPDSINVQYSIALDTSENSAIFGSIVPVSAIARPSNCTR